MLVLQSALPFDAGIVGSRLNHVFSRPLFYSKDDDLFAFYPAEQAAHAMGRQTYFVIAWQHKEFVKDRLFCGDIGMRARNHFGNVG